MWDDDNDEELARALEESRRLYLEVEEPRLSQLQKSSDTPSCFTTDVDAEAGGNELNFVPRPLLPSTNRVQDADGENEELYEGPEAEGFSLREGQQWIYPTNYSLRSYQKHIVEMALFNNTLVSLPTGLGKTFIAAVVMYNFYKWYPKGKIIFMAPTKPLVAQQIENCYDIMGIPYSDTAEMTGAMHAKDRAMAWQEKRVFFLTPQVVQNDLGAGICPANAVKCVVIDEAHKALGDHSYSQVIRSLNSYEAKFRVLALSATPGSDTEAVQKVVSNLMISHIELRSENSPDILQYTHQRLVETVIVSIGPTLQRIREKYVGVISDYARRLQQLKVLFGNASSYTNYTVLKAKQEFMSQPPQHFPQNVINNCISDFCVVQSLAHGLELLQTYGMRLLHNHLQGLISGEKGIDSVGRRLSVNEDLKNLMTEIDNYLNPVETQEDDSDTMDKKKRMVYGHPKLDRLQDLIVSHFESFKKEGKTTKAIIFCEYREGVVEISDMLKNFEPLVKPVPFMGQASGKGAKGIPQKRQLEVMEKFRQGRYNTLVSTCVGEEGLDIGEVDLIICFDAKNSPIRQVQRMGRTGRKRKGRIIMLITAGKEEHKYKISLLKKDNINSVLLSKENLAGYLLDSCPSMLPPGIHPKCVECHIKVPQKLQSVQQDLRKMLLKKSSGRRPGSSCNDLPINKSPYVSEDDLQDMNDWDVVDCTKFDRLPAAEEYWCESIDSIMSKDENPSKLDLSAYLEHMRLKQRTHVIPNSSDSKLLTDLLLWAEERQDDLMGTQCATLSTEVSSSQIWATKKNRKKGKQPPVAENKLTNVKGTKRGRPCKNEKDAMNVEGAPQEQPSSSKFKGGIAQFLIKETKRPQFIDEEEEDDDDNGSELLPVFKLPLKGSPSVPVAKSPCVSMKSPPPSPHTVHLTDSDEDDLNISSHSESSLTFTQSTRRDTLDKLYKALQKQQQSAEEDVCDVCDTFFPCEVLNKIVHHTKKYNQEESWKSVCESLKAAVSVVPLITLDSFSNLEFSQHSSTNKSPEAISLIPRNTYMFEEEVFDGGVLCGGIGDYTEPPTCSPKVEKQSQGSTFLRDFCNEFSRSFGEGNSKVVGPLCAATKISISDKIILNSTVTEFSNEQKKLTKASPEAEKDLPENYVGDDTFDFLGILDIEDVFLDRSQKKETVKESAVSRPGGETVSSVNNAEYAFQDESKLTASTRKSPLLANDATKDTLHLLSCQSDAETPYKTLGSPSEVKKCNSAEDPISPILCSQVSKRPRNLRLKKDNATSSASSCCSTPKAQKSLFSRSTHNDSNVQSPPDFSSVHLKQDFPVKKGGRSERSISPDSTTRESLKETTVLSSPSTPVRSEKPNLDFELWDENLWMNDGDNDMSHALDQGTSSSIVLDTSVKEAIRNKALEVFSKPSKKSLTQTVRELKESSVENSGFTQLLELIDSETGNKNIKADMVGADSSFIMSKNEPSPVSSESLSQELERNVLEVAIIGDHDEGFNASDEDMFADDDDDIAVAVDSSVLQKYIGTGKTDWSGQLRSESPTNKGAESQRQQVQEFQTDSKKVNVRSGETRNCLVTDCDTNFPSPANNLHLDRIQKPEHITQPEKKRSKLSLKSSKPRIAIESSKDFSNNLSKEDRGEKCDKKVVETKLLNSPSIKPSQANLSLDGFDFNTSWSQLDSNGKVNTSFKTVPNSRVQPHHREQSVKATFSSGIITRNEVLCRDSNELNEYVNTRDIEGFVSSSKIVGTKRCEDLQQIVTDTKKPLEILLTSSDDEEIVAAVRKKKKNPCLNITTTSEEGDSKLGNQTLSSQEDVQEVPNPKRKRVLVPSASSNEKLGASELLCVEMKPCNNFTRKHEKRKCESNTQNHDLSNFCDESLLTPFIDQAVDSSDDEDFQSAPNKIGRNQRTKGERTKPKKLKKKKPRCAFLVSEAEESAEDRRNSSDGETTSLDEMDSSFINDSPPEGSQNVTDIHAKYLQSVRSPLQAAGRFKIPARPPPVNFDVYSQVPHESELDQSYANDSFVNDEEPTQYDNEMSLLEIAEARIKAERKEKRRLKKLGSLEGIPEKGLKRKIEHDISSNLCKKQKSEAHGRQLKRIRVLDASDSDEEPNLASNHTVPNAALDQASKAQPKKTPVHYNEISSVINDDASLAALLDDDIDFGFILEDKLESVATSKPSTSPSNTTTFFNQRSTFVKKSPIMSGPAAGSSLSLSKIRPSACGNQTNALMTSSWYTGNKATATVTSSESAIPSGQRKCVQKTYETTSAVKPTGTCALSTKVKSSSTVIVVITASRQVASATDIMRVMRVTYNVTIVPRSINNADFIVSWRLGITRISMTDMKDRKKLEQVVKLMKEYFSKPTLIVEKDRVKGVLAAMNSKKSTKGNSKSNSSANNQPLWTSVTCSTVALLKQAGVCILFSQSKDDTARLIVKLAQKENLCGHGIPQIPQNISEEVQTRLRFYSGLPGVNLALAFKVLQKFSTVAGLLASCSSVRDIASNFGVDLDKARKIHSVLCELHVSP